MFNYPIPTSDELVLWFDRLTGALSTYRLPADPGQTVYRQAGADEFMLMDIDRAMVHGYVVAKFKHIASRNYLHLRYAEREDVCYPVVPIGGDFNRGYFPAPVEIGTAT